MNRGYFGVGIYQTKDIQNVGCLWRTAYAMGASFIFTIGKRYQHDGTNTPRVERHTPLFNYKTFEDFFNNIPKNCIIICIEQHVRSHSIKNFVHPERAIYLLGAEDDGIPEEILNKYTILSIPSKICLNVAVAGSLVLFDRKMKYKGTGK